MATENKEMTEDLNETEETPETAGTTEEKTQAAEENQEAQDENELKIAQLTKDLAASNEAHIRTLAEYDNYRKRTTKEKEGIYSNATVACMTELLPVLDNFDRALSITDSDVEAYKKGMEMIYTNFMEILKKLNVEPFGEAGESFDPNFHNAVMHIEDDTMEKNVIAEVFSKGYKLGDKLLRPAMVKVAN